MFKKYYNLLFLFYIFIFLSACGFHLQGETHLAPPLHRLYLKTSNPYGYLTRNLRQAFKASHVQLVSSPTEANTILTILTDDTSQELLSVSGTQQTRQYNLKVSVNFQITDPQGRIWVDTQTLSENRTITIQSNQILGSSNEVSLMYRQMRRTLANSIMNRLASKEITDILMQATKQKKP